MSTTLAPARALTAEDRCDRCGAQAYVRVTLTAGGELHFCAHHMRLHGTKLRALASSIHDESERLGSTTSTAPADER